MLLLTGGLIVGANQAAGQETAASDKSITFEQHIAPLLETRCSKCHGEAKLEAGLDVRRKFQLEKGGDSGPAIVPGKPDESPLVQRIESGEMPPKEEAPLDARHKELIRRWVAAGAPLAGDGERPLAEAEEASRITDDDRQFWSFRPPVRPALPLIQHADRATTSIDAFLLSRLEERGLSFAADAPAEVMLRRGTFALTGMPPTPDEREAFLADGTADAYERLVDRLLASPRFGEHTARQWLDVAGYADSDGYLAADRLRPQAWRYRDYVIGALNADLPYDQFLLEQLAGDELSDWRRAEELSPGMQRQLAATGFLRTASDPTYPGYTEPNEIHQVLSDTLQIVSTSLMGLTLHCARCHAHKFDPLPQRDYYALQAILRPALDPARWQPSEVRGILLATEAEQAQISDHNQKVDKRIGELNAELAALTARFRKKRVVAALQERASDAALVEMLIAALLLEADKRNEEQKGLVAQHVPQLTLAEKDLAAWSSEYSDQSAKLQAAIASETAIKQPIVLIRGLMDLDDKPADTNLLVRGDPSKPGAVVPPMVPEVLAASGYTFQPQADYKTTGRREAFARWLIDPQHPLTARVHVNRVWAQLFGRGIVPTLANFGRSGARPTHPQLLDWLAVEFSTRGWSQKTLYRRLLSSAAWRQSSEPTPTSVAADPDHELWSSWRAQRITGEMLRDATLSAAEKLNGRMFGEPSAVAAQGDGSVLTAADAAGSRRSIYLQVRRSQHVTMLELFDVPMMEINCPERPSSIVPLQALALLHGPFAEQSAAALAERILHEAASDDERIALAWQLVYSREPKPQEQQTMREFLAAIVREKLGDSAATAASGPRQDAEKSAWTQAALVLLNSNEFLYIH